MSIGTRIKERRIELNMSVDEVANLLGKNRATIYRYESNEIENLPASTLEPLAKVLKTTPAYLMGWEDETSNEVEVKEQVKILAREANDLTDTQLDLIRSMIKQFKENK